MPGEWRLQMVLCLLAGPAHRAAMAVDAVYPCAAYGPQVY
jgi:hypothetical protein